MIHVVSLLEDGGSLFSKECSSGKEYLPKDGDESKETVVKFWKILVLANMGSEEALEPQRMCSEKLF